MSSDATSDSHGPPNDSAATRSSAIELARAQVDAASLRARELLASGKLLGNALSSPAPSSFPGYVIVRELHRGGQGTVYLAIQQSTERQVAIKVLRREWTGGSDAGTLRSSALVRFEREVDILSRLKHPNVVTIHDCGRDRGLVYLVMDYVEGRPVDVWARRPGATLDETLDVFAKICDGINAAHLIGAIHRDLKPANILVDEEGVPHVLDFGLAKLVEPSRNGGAVSTAEAPSRDAVASTADRPAVTETGQFVGSLPWASPEQAESGMDESAAPLDIRTDVYSLGVILYQLLTGRFPYPVNGKLSDVVRHINESEPVRPSSIVRTIDRELETIVLKCLAKQPDRRYQTAGDVARDIRRLRAGEAIEARRDSLVYVMAKRLARYRVAAIASAAIVAVAVVALVVTSLSLKEADRRARQSSAVTEFMRSILTSVEAEKAGADVRMADVLRAASAEASGRFVDHPDQEAEIRILLGEVFHNLSMWTEANVEFRRGKDLWQSVAGENDPRTLSADLLSAQALLSLGRLGESEVKLTDVVSRMERELGPHHSRTLSAQALLAYVILHRGRVEEAERRLVELRDRPELADVDGTQFLMLQALIDVRLGRLGPPNADETWALLRDAERLAQECVDRAARAFGPDSPKSLLSVAKWADIICRLRRYEDAARTCRELLARTERQLSDCHQARASAMCTLAEALVGLGDDVEPARIHLARLRCMRDQVDPQGILMVTALYDSLRFFERAGPSVAAEGEALARELVTNLQKIGGGHGQLLLVAELFVARFVSLQGRIEEAEPLFRDLLSREAAYGEDHQARARLHLYHAGHAMLAGRFPEAEAELQRATELAGDVRNGTWDTHPDDIVVGFIRLYEVWGRQEDVRTYRVLRDEALAPREERTAGDEN